MARLSGTHDELRAERLGIEEMHVEQRTRPIWSLLGNPYLTLISRLLLGGIFFLSGLSKLGVPDTFAENIKSYEMHLPGFLVQAMSVGLPPLELGLGVWLLVGLFTRFSGGVSAALMLVFLIAMVQAAFRGLSPNCGCFEGAQGNALGTALINALGSVGSFLANEKVGVGSIARDLLFLLMSVHLIFVPTVFAVDSLRHRNVAETIEP